MTEDQIRTRAIDRFNRLRRIARTALAAHQGLDDELQELRQRAMRSASDLRGHAVRGRYDRGAEWDADGRAIGLRTKVRRSTDGVAEYDVERVHAAELDHLARRAKSDAAKYGAARDLADAAGERWKATSPLADAAEKFLVARGWLEMDEPFATDQVLGPSL